MDEQRIDTGFLETDNFEVELQENIPLSDEDLQHILTAQRGFAKTIPIVLAGCTLFFMLFMSWLIRDKFATFKYYDYILFICAGLAMFGICYLMSLLVSTYDNRNWKKDKLNGKNRLRSVIINRDKTEYAEYLTFAGKEAKDKIRIRVKEEDYSRLKVGAKIDITYLKYSREALKIVELDKKPTFQ